MWDSDIGDVAWDAGGVGCEGKDLEGRLWWSWSWSWGIVKALSGILV